MLATNQETIVAVQKRIHLLQMEWGFREHETSPRGHCNNAVAEAFGRYRELVELRDAMQHPRYLNDVYCR